MPIEVKKCPIEGLYEIQPKVFEVFQLVGFSQFCNIKSSFSESLEIFQSGSESSNSLFPIIFSCPVCSKRLKATHSGRFRCSECKSILTVDAQGQVSLG